VQTALVYRDATGTFVLATLGGARPRPLGAATQALLAPNGSLVVALAGGSSGVLTIYHITKTKRANAVSLLRVGARVAARLHPPQWSAAHIQLLAWSPDSRLVALIADRLSAGGEQPELLVLDTTSDTLHTIAAGNFFGASFAPTLPARLVYADATVAQLDDNVVPLFTANANGSGRREINGSGLDADPVWGAKGIVFARLGRLGSASRSPRYQLWLIQPNGRGLRKLTHIIAGPPAPNSAGAALSVSANGARVVANFSSPFVTFSAIDIWTVNLAPPRPVAHRLTFDGAQFIAEGLSRNGTRILLSALDSDGQQTGVESLPWAGEPRTALATPGADPSWNG
jgi:hypothetical protein